MRETLPTWEDLAEMLIQANNLAGDLLDLIEANGISTTQSINDRISVLLMQARELGVA